MTQDRTTFEIVQDGRSPAADEARTDDAVDAEGELRTLTFEELRLVAGGSENESSGGGGETS